MRKHPLARAGVAFAMSYVFAFTQLAMPVAVYASGVQQEAAQAAEGGQTASNAAAGSGSSASDGSAGTGGGASADNAGSGDAGSGSQSGSNAGTDASGNGSAASNGGSQAGSDTSADTGSNSTANGNGNSGSSSSSNGTASKDGATVTENEATKIDPGEDLDADATADDELATDSAESQIDEQSDALPVIEYQAHVQDIGWQKAVTDGATAGTSGKAKRIEAIKVAVKGAKYKGTVQVRAHVQDIGWQNWTNGQGGTSGQSKRVEAMQLQLTEELAQKYDIYYRVHAQNIGWMGWAKNGEKAGTSGYSYRLEAIQIKLVHKNAAAPGSTANAFKKPAMSFTYSAHVQDIGWMKAVGNGGVAGTTGRSKRVEAINTSLANADYSGDVQGNAHVQDIGWQGWRSGTVGTSGRSLRVEAVQYRLTGDLANKYDIYYRVHAENFGWMGWAKNGASAGTQGYSYRLEAVQIKLVSKGAAAPGSTENTFRIAPEGVQYSAHVQDIGWQGTVSDGATAGTTGRGKRVEALSISIKSQQTSGSIQGNAHVQNVGWQGWRTGTVGTSGRGLRIEAIQLRLTGELANKYDVYYRVHAQNYGWMGWAKNGASAGTEGFSYRVEAIQIRLVKKGGSAPGSTAHAFQGKPTIAFKTLARGSWSGNSGSGGTSGTTGRSLPLSAMSATVDGKGSSGGISYRTHCSNIGWTGWSGNGGVSGSSNSSQKMQAVQINLTGEIANNFDIYYRVHIDNVGWMGWAKNGGWAGTTGLNLNIQAIQIVIRSKAEGAPGGGTAFANTTAGLPYVGFQNPSWMFQVSNRSVTIKNQGSGIFGYRTESRIPYNATRAQCVNAVVTRAYDYLGTSYIWDYACAPGVGVDCAGLVMQCLYAAGMNLSPFNPYDHRYTPGHDHYANDMWNCGRFQKLSYSQAQPGDILSWSGHVAIYIGGGKMIEAANPQVGVRLTNVNTKGLRGVLRPFA